MKPTVNNMNWNLRPLWIALTAVTLSGCNLLGPLYSRPESPLPASYVEPADQQAGNPAETQQWWSLFNDALLNDIIQKALTNNSDIQLAVARIEQYDAIARATSTNVLPTVTLNEDSYRQRITEAGPNPVFTANPRNDHRLALNGTIELDIWGKLKQANNAARANLLATRYAKEAVRWSLVGLVTNQYLAVRSLDGQLAVNAENVKTAEESLAMTQRQLNAGIVTALDVHQAELVVTDLRAQALELQRQRSVGEHQLGVLTADLSIKVPESGLMTMPVPPVPPAGLPSTLLEARPDIRQAEQQLIAEHANLAVAKASLYPTLSLTGAFGSESNLLKDLFTAPAKIWTTAFAAGLPIFNGGRLNAQIDQASAIQKQAVITYQATLRTAFNEVNDALVNARRYREQETVAQSKEQTTANILRISQNRYEAGYTSYLDVLVAQRNHNEATQALVQTRQNTLTATVSLFKALGGGWDPETVAQATTTKK
jgi:outer membrane protein, multidrug efflux system